MKYISLFSSAGIGTYGLKELGHNCIATNEFLPERMEIQKYNNISKNDDAYITGDITTKEVKDKIYLQNKIAGGADIIIATPPCQGISLLNLKKNENDKYRNSLVVESLEIIKEIKPKLFILENVRNFLKTACLYKNNWRSIEEAIKEELGSEYSIAMKMVNLKHLGSASSRTRTIIIGVKNSIAKHFSPWELFPDKVKNIPTLGKVISKNSPLIWGQIDEKDFYHSFRTYDERMRPWIEHTPPGMSAFDNESDELKPHKIIGNKLVPNKNSTGDKYMRQDPNISAKCIMTRNDQLASQNTIHPYEDRVFSIRELMQMMTIPKSFRFVNFSLKNLNAMTLEQKKIIYKKNELNMRRTIGEAVPTFLFKKIVSNFQDFDSRIKINSKAEAIKWINEVSVSKPEDLIKHISSISRLSLNICFEELSYNAKGTGMYFTNPIITTKLINEMSFKGKHILEPSVGIGSMLIPLIKAYPERDLVLDVYDINPIALKVLKEIVGKNIAIKYHNKDFVKINQKDDRYDLIFGNPPYIAIKYGELLFDKFKNLFEAFTIKSLSLSKNVVFVLPKYILFNNKFSNFRNSLLTHGPNRFWDFKGMLFPNAKIETIVVHFNSKKNKTFVSDNIEYNFDFLTNSISSIWTIHPDKELFKYMDTLRYMNLKSKRLLSINKHKVEDGKISMLTSLNLRDKTSKIQLIKTDKKEVLDRGFLVPNMTTNIKAVYKEPGIAWDGSLALISGYDERYKKEIDETWNSETFRKMVSMLRSHAQRSINIDKEIIKHFGVKHD